MFDRILISLVNTKDNRGGVGLEGPFPPGGAMISPLIAVAEGLNNAAILGVKGGVIHGSGQSDNPVRSAIAGGNGSPIPAPSAGYENEV